MRLTRLISTIYYRLVSDRETDRKTDRQGVGGEGDRRVWMTGWMVWVTGVDGVGDRGWVVWVTDKRDGWCRRQAGGGCCG